MADEKKQQASQNNEHATQKQASEPVVKIEAQPKQVETVVSSKSKGMDPKTAKLMQLIRIYKDKVKEFQDTRSDEIKLWKFFYEIGQYVLEQRKTELMDIFFREYVRDSDLHDNLLALRMIYECKDVHIKNRVTAFYQVHDALRRFFKDRNNGAKCFLSIRAISRTFEGFPEFVNWVNVKRSK